MTTCTLSQPCSAQLRAMMLLRSSAEKRGALAGFCDRNTTTSSAIERASLITHIWPLVIGSRVPENPIFFIAAPPPCQNGILAAACGDRGDNSATSPHGQSLRCYYR